MAELGFYVVDSPRDIGKPFILLNDIYVDHFSNSRSLTRGKDQARRMDTKQYFKGTLLREVITSGSDLSESRVLCRNPESEEYFHCSRKDLDELSESVYQLLLAISNCRARFDVYRDNNHLADGLDMKIGDRVYVTLTNHTGHMEGKIRFKGEVSERDGTLFGVELFNADGRGNCNGTYGKVRYFDCATDSGVFLPLNRVRPAAPSSSRTQPRSSTKRNKLTRNHGSTSSSHGRASPETCPFMLNISQEELDGLSIQHGSEVYIFTEVNGQESQEKGKVVFIGRLPGNSNKEIYVGIDLHKPVGNGTGLFNGKHLFYTKQNHAALVPLSGVLPAALGEEATSSLMDRHTESPRESRNIASVSTKKSRRNPNSSPSHRLRESDVAPRDRKPFVPPSQHISHSSPSVISSRNIEDELIFRESSKYRSTKKSMKPTSLSSMSELYQPGSRNPIMVRDGMANVGDVVKSRSPLGDPSDNSDNEMDLYGSDNTIATQHLNDKKDSHILNYDVRNVNTGKRHGRQRETASVPEIPSQPMAKYKNRQVHTIPDYQYNGRLSEMVSMKAITNMELMRQTPTNFDEVGDMEVGTMVEVPSITLGSSSETGPVYGVIKWIGKLPEETELAAGIELENIIPNGNDGMFDGIQYFSCEVGRGHFVFLKFCKKDSRFFSSDFASAISRSPMPKDFGSLESPIVKENVPPPLILSRDMIGKRRGIQGHHNSCYLDSTLFSLFAYSQVIDSILFRPRKNEDLPEYEEAQKLLRESIINPLRRHHFVRADRIMQLRELLDKLGSTSGLVNEEKDPEEFLNTLLHQVFKAEPLHELRQGDSNAAHEGFFYQIFMEKDENFVCPSTQQLIEKSLISADLKFRHVPVCLILQMPRFGKDYKMYKRLKPTLQLDLTNLVEESPRSCDVCESLAEFECRDCFMESSTNESNFSYCIECARRVHQHRKRVNHGCKPIRVPDDYKEYYNHRSSQGDTPIIQPQVMELFAVVCIATSHYVSFTRCGYGKDASWVFFDSMADRVGEQNGYNIPEITPCPDVEKWLNLNERDILREDEKLMPELKRRLLCDSYMCMYQSLDLMVNK